MKHLALRSLAALALLSVPVVAAAPNSAFNALKAVTANVSGLLTTGRLAVTGSGSTGDVSGMSVTGNPSGAAGSLARQILSIPGTTPDAQGAPATGDATSAITAAVASGFPVDLLPHDYPYTADTLDATKLGRVPLLARIRSVMAGDSLIRDRAGKPIGLAYNHRLQQDYSGSYPRNVPATAITSGNLASPPVSFAQAAGPVDVIAHWYGDWGLDFYRQATGIGSSPFDGWYDWRWNWTSSASYDPSRRSILGYYRNDDPKVLDWQSYWLREAGVKTVVPVAFDLEISSWYNSDDRNYWVYNLFNAPNFKGLTYIPWARSSNFENTTAASGAPANVTQAQILSQWQSLYYGLAPAYPNNYVLNYAGKRWFTVYVWDTEQLRLLYDTGSSSTNFAAFLAARAAEVVAQGYGGIAVMVHNATPDSTMSRSALLGQNVLYLPSPYSGPVNSTPTAQTYAGVVAGYSPPARGQVLNISTGLNLVSPLPASPTFAYPGATPALFQTWATKAISWVVNHKSLPQILTVSNVSEWAEQGAGLHPNAQDGWGYLDAIRGAASSISALGGSTKLPLTLQNGWANAATGNEPAQVWKDMNGVVRVSGVITGGTTSAGTTLTTLPAGFCPLATEVFPVGVSGGAASIYVGSNCNIVALGALNAGTTGLSGIQFKVD